MINTLINLKIINTIATALGTLNNNVVYVGGAVVSLYIDDKAAEDVRPTKDIDISLDISTITELESLRVDLTKKGFKQSYEDDVMCRFRYNDIKIDVMATVPIGWAPANPWFKLGFDAAISVEVEETEIKILPLPYFLASKFSAFYDRGGKDPRGSHDFEDIVYVLNYTSNFKEQILIADKEVKQFLKEAFLKIIESAALQEAILCNIYYEEQDLRFDNILSNIKEIVASI